MSMAKPSTDAADTTGATDADVDVANTLPASEDLPATVTPPYWDEACRHLAKRDRVMKKLIPKFGEARLQSRGDAFTTLARSIVGQQISVKAAQAVWNRFASAVGGPPSRLTPQAVMVLDMPKIGRAHV